MWNRVLTISVSCGSCYPGYLHWSPSDGQKNSEKRKKRSVSAFTVETHCHKIFKCLIVSHLTPSILQKLFWIRLHYKCYSGFRIRFSCRLKKVIRLLHWPVVFAWCPRCAASGAFVTVYVTIVTDSSKTITKLSITYRGKPRLAESLYFEGKLRQRRVDLVVCTLL